MFLAPSQGAPAGGPANPGRCPGLTSRGAFSARTTLSLKLCAPELFNGLVIQTLACGELTQEDAGCANLFRSLLGQ